jgi:hypothetical protein
MDTCLQILDNVAIYIEYLPLESQQSHWTLVIQELEKLFHHMYLYLNKSNDCNCIFLIMTTLLKVNSISTCKVRIYQKKLFFTFIFKKNPKIRQFLNHSLSYFVSYYKIVNLISSI